MVLDLDKKSSFLNWKLASARKAFPDGHQVIRHGYEPPARITALLYGHGQRTRATALSPLAPPTPSPRLSFRL
ncbi:MAG: hypothetical protein R6V25_14605 [Desulfatiglandales bacterium]